MSKEINNFISEISLDENFWEVNPHFKYLTDFKDLYNNDKSKNKEISSRQLWAIVLQSDVNSPWRRMSPEKRKEEVISFIEDKFKWEDIEPYFKKYEENSLTEKQQLFKSWGDKLRAREQFIKQTDYKQTTFKMLDEMMSETKKMWDMYSKVENEMMDESRIETMKGGRRKSKSERKVL